MIATKDLERLFAVSALFLQRTWLDCLKQSNPVTKVKITMIFAFGLVCYDVVGQRGDEAGWREEEDEAHLPLQAELHLHLRLPPFQQL